MKQCDLDLIGAKGPFEMLEEIGVANFFSKFKNFEGNKFLENLAETKNENFHRNKTKIYRH